MADVPVISATKTTSTNVLYPGEVFSYGLTIKNLSTVPTTAPFTITDTLPPNVVLSGTPLSTAGPVVNEGTNTQLNLSVSGSVPPGGQVVVSIPVSLSTSAPVGVMMANVATIDPGHGGAVANATENSPAIVENPPLLVTKTASKSTLDTQVNNTFIYTVTITNNTGAPSTNPISVYDNLPPNVLPNGTPTSSLGPVTNSGNPQQLLLSIAGTLGVGQTATVSIPVVISQYTPIGPVPVNMVQVDIGNGQTAFTSDKNTPWVVSSSLIGSKNASVTTTYPGGTYDYILNLYNDGQQATTDPYLVQDVLPAGVTLNGNATSTTPGVTFTKVPGMDAFWISPSLQVGQHIQITIPVKVATNAPQGVLDNNQIIVLPDIDDESVEVDVTETSPPTVQAPQLIVEKQASANYLIPGEQYHYVITITNTGAVPTTTPFTVYDNLPAGVTYAGNATSTIGPLTNTGDYQNLNLTVDGFIPAGGTGTITIPVVLARSVGVGQLPPNVATVVPGNGGGDVTTTEVNPPIVSIPVPTVMKTSTVDTTLPGGTFDYVVTVENNSNVATSNPFTVSDVLPAFVMLNGTISTSAGTVVNNGTTTNLQLNLTPALQPGESLTLTIPVVVANDAPIGELGGNVLTLNPGNGGNVVTGEDKNPPIIYLAVLAGQKTATVKQTYPGGTFNYVIGLANQGNYPTDNPLVLTDVLPAGVTLAEPPVVNKGTITGTTGMNGANQVVTLTYTPGLPAGGSVLITLPVVVAQNQPTGALDNNEVTVGDVDFLDATPPIVANALGEISKVATYDLLAVGDVFAYEITVTNTGTVPFSNPFTVSDTLPPEVEIAEPVTASDGATVVVSGSGNVYDFDVYEALAPGRSVVINVPVKVLAGTTVGPLTPNTATLTPGNGGATVTTTEETPPVVDVPAPVVLKTSSESDVTPGGTFLYTVEITNTGGVPFSNPFTATDILPDGLSLAGGVISPSATVTNAGDDKNLNLTIQSGLAPGATMTLYIPVVVDDDAPLGVLSNNEFVVAPGNGGAEEIGIDKNPPTVKYPALAITKVANTSYIPPCGTFDYVITVTNTGNVFTDNPLVVADDLPNYVTLAGTPTSDSGAVVNYGSDTNLNLSVDTSLAPGDSLTITLPVQVACDAPLDELSIRSGATGNTSPPPPTPVVNKQPDFTDGTLTQSVDTVCPDEQICYILTATNTGATSQHFTAKIKLPKVKLTDGRILTGSLVAQSVTGTIDNEEVQVRHDPHHPSPTFTMNKQVLNGATATINYCVTVPKLAATPQTMTTLGSILSGTMDLQRDVEIISCDNSQPVPCCCGGWCCCCYG